MIEGVIDLGDTVAREVMVPRIDIVGGERVAAMAGPIAATRATRTAAGMATKTVTGWLGSPKA